MQSKSSYIPRHFLSNNYQKRHDMSCNIYDSTDYSTMQFLKIEHFISQLERNEYAPI